MHGYALELENARNIAYNERVDAAFFGLLGGLPVTIVGIAMAVTSDPDYQRLRSVGILMAISGAALFIWAAVTTTIGVVRWRRNSRIRRAQEAAAMAAVEGKPVRLITPGQRRRY